MTAEPNAVAENARRRPQLRRWLQPPLSATIDLLFPPRCVACASECEPPCGAAMLCPTCNAQLVVSERPACPRCARLCSAVDLSRGDCGDCRSRKLLFTAARTIGTYQGALRQAVLKGKHAGFGPLANALGQRLAEAIERLPFAERLDLVVSVPLHWLKRFWRGTNPANTIALAVARHLDLPLAGHALVCTRLLRRQATLTPPERRRNVRGAFRASWRANIKGKRVLLIDDVMTTGATAHEGSRALLEAGAAAVYVATVARSSPEF